METTQSQLDQQDTHQLVLRHLIPGPSPGSHLGIEEDLWSGPDTPSQELLEAAADRYDAVEANSRATYLRATPGMILPAELVLRSRKEQTPPEIPRSIFRRATGMLSKLVRTEWDETIVRSNTSSDSLEREAA